MFGIDDLLGGAVSAYASWRGQRDANRSNENLSRENRLWQERMSNTAYQRQMADMKKAGLNPILAAGGGGGASTPSAPVAQMQSETSGISNSAMNVFQMANLKKQNAAIDADIDYTRAKAEAVRASIPGNSAKSQWDARKYGAGNSIADAATGNPSGVFDEIGRYGGKVIFDAVNSARDFKNKAVSYINSQRSVSSHLRGK